VKIEETLLELKKPKKWARLIQIGNPREISQYTAHYVFLVSSTIDKRKWYIDITGAQYGIYTPVWGTDVYMKEFGNKVVAIPALGTAKAELLEIAEIRSRYTTALGIQFRQAQGITDTLRQAVKLWQASNALDSSAFLLHGVCRYKALENLVLQAVDKYVARYDRASEMDKLKPYVENADQTRERTFLDELKAKQYALMILKYGV